MGKKKGEIISPVQSFPWGILNKYRVEHTEDPVEILFGEVAARGEAEAFLEEVGRGAVAIVRGIGEDRLQVHRFPEGAALDVVGFEGEPDGFAGDAVVPFRVYGDGRKPAVRIVSGRFGLYDYLVSPGIHSVEVILVPGKVFAPGSHTIVEHLHLSAPDGSHHVAHAVVIADVRMLVMGSVVAGLRGQETGFGDHFAVV